MLNNLFKVIIIFIFLSSVVLCKELDTDQQKIDSAIQIIKQKSIFNSNIEILQGKNYTHKPVKLLFKDLSEIDFSFSKHYAITATDEHGDLYILINNSLKGCDVRVLACLILHESNHCKENKPDSVAEEILSHEQEFFLYTSLLNEDVTLKDLINDRLVVRENRLKKLFDDAIQNYLSGNETYVNYLHLK